MEDVMQFLLVAGILAFGIFRQFNKEKNKKSEKGNSMPAPEYEYEPEFEEPVIIEKTYEQVTASPKPPVFQEGTRNTYTPPSPPKTNKKAETCKNDFPFVRQKRQGVPSSGRKYFEENINIDILTRKIYDFYGT